MTSQQPNKIDYNNLVFKAVSNTENGETSTETIFHYRQDGDIISATYEGGSILYGNLVGTVVKENQLHFRYNHVNSNYQLRSGMCTSTPVILPDGRIRLHEKWQWTVDQHSEGESLIEEMKK